MKSLVPVKWLPMMLFSMFLGSELSAYDVNKTGSGLEIKWAAPSATYYINAAGGASGSASAIQRAMQSWSGVNGSAFSFVYGGTTISSDWGVNDGVNILIFGPMSDAGLVAENYFWYSNVSGKIFDSDIKFNTNYVFSSDGSGYDVESIALHELGHSLSLKDLYNSGDSDKVMYYQAKQGQTKQFLQADDINGIAHLYPFSSCASSISQRTQTFASAGGTGSITVTSTSSKCPWTAVSNSPWVVVTSGANGVGNGSISYSVSANNGAGTRIGTITVGGKTLTITESGVRQYLLTIAKSGSGSGTVTSDPSGIDCGNDCLEFYSAGTSVTVESTADSGSVFTGWSGECPGQVQCTVTMTSDRTLTALFDQQQGTDYSLSLNAGWNFISIPVNPANPAIGEILRDISGDVRVVWGYDNQVKQWLRYPLSNQSSALDTLGKIEVGKGYWIFMNNARSLTIKVDHTAPGNITLHEGWNLVGYNGVDGVSVGNALSDVSTNWMLVWRWEKGGWAFTSSSGIAMPPLVFQLSAFARGQAHWIRMKDTGGSLQWKTDLTPPNVLSVSPLENSRDVPVNTVVAISFDEDVDCAAFTETNFYLTAGTNKVSGVIGCTGKNAGFIPSTSLSYDTTYTLTITSGLRDIKGNRLQSGHSWSFTTVASPESIIRRFKVGDTFNYLVILKSLANGQEYSGDVTYTITGSIMNPYGATCLVTDITGTLTGQGRSVSMNTKSLYFQDAQGNAYDCGDYNKDTGQYNFIKDDSNTPNGTSLDFKSPVRIGDVISVGTVNYHDGSWKDCDRSVTGREAVASPAGSFQTFKIISECREKDGSNYTSVLWLDPPLDTIKEIVTYTSGVEATMTLKSYTLAP